MGGKVAVVILTTQPGCLRLILNESWQSWTLNAQSLCHVQWTGMGKTGKTSMCHHANAHCTHPYVALNNLHVVAGDSAGHSAVTEPSPNLSQSSHSVCYACRQPRFLMRLTQLPMHSFVSLPHLQVWEEEELWYAIQQRSLPLLASLWSIWSHLLRPTSWPSASQNRISTPHRSHFDD